MEVHFTPEQEAEIAKLAASIGTAPEVLVKGAAMRLLGENTHRHADTLKDKNYGAWNEFSREEKMNTHSEQPPRSPQEAAERIREIQQRTKPDPESWTVKDYINYGRRA